MKTSYFEQLFEHTILSDIRLARRFGLLAGTLFDNFGKSIPQSFTDRSQVKAAYNFLNHPTIKYDMLVSAERARMISRIASDKPSVILAIQDTTELTYTGNRSDAELGYMRYETVKGFYLHNHLIFNPQGIGLGIFDQKLWNYSREEVGKLKEKRKQRSFEDKASYRWYEQFEDLQDAFEQFPATTVIDITDREGDIHELLQARRTSNVHYIIRGRGDRKEHLTNVHVKELMQKQTVTHIYEVKVLASARDNNNAAGKRVARIGLSYQRITLHPPFRKSTDIIPCLPIEVTIVYAKEIDPPEDVAEPIEWVLYTSLPVKSVEDAVQITDYYKQRWLIEIFHFVLKQGAKIEELQLETAQGLGNAIATYSIVSLQVQNLRYARQEYAQKPVEQVPDLNITSQDYKLAASYLNGTYKKHDIDKVNPTVDDFFKLIAQLGGFQMQKNKSPGVKIMWRGWQQWIIIKKVALVMKK